MRANARKAWPFALKEPVTDDARVAWVQMLVEEFEQVLRTDARSLLQEFSAFAPAMQAQASRGRFPEAIAHAELSPK